MTAMPASPVDAYGQRHSRAEGRVRIVSLVPSITELLCDLGLAAQVVGRTGFCIHPRAVVRSIAKLGGTKDVDLAALIALAPTHVIVNIDENTHATYLALRDRVPQVVITHPNTPSDNLELYGLLGAIFACEPAAERLSVAFSAAHARLRQQAAALPARRVLYLIWREPWMTVAPATYISAMLALVNWRTVPAAPAHRYPALSNAELVAQQPDLCLLSSEPYPFRARHIAELQRLLGADVPVRLIDGEMISWYGSRAVAGLDYLTQFAASALAPAT